MVAKGRHEIVNEMKRGVNKNNRELIEKEANLHTERMKDVCNEQKKARQSFCYGTRNSWQKLGPM